MKSNEPLTTCSLKNIGINKPGHIVRLLALLNLENLNRNNKQNPSNHNNISCCVAPNNINSGINIFQTLDKWLEAINLAPLFKKFIESGYDDLEHLIILMNSNYPVTDDVLKSEVKIDKLGYRHRILAKLKQDANFKTNHRHDLSIEKESKSVACEKCFIM